MLLDKLRIDDNCVITILSAWRPIDRVDIVGHLRIEVADLIRRMNATENEDEENARRAK